MKKSYEIQNYMKLGHKDCIFYLDKSKVCNGIGVFAKKI